jgi:hypothetical protein
VQNAHVDRAQASSELLAGLPPFPDAIETRESLVKLRHEYYTVEEGARAAAEGHASLFVAKQRQGPVGQVELVFQKEIMRFAEMDFPDETASAAVDPP